jgi:PAS domain S-box-containing protein
VERVATDEEQLRLREANDEFESAFRYAAIGMSIVALDGRWLKVNKSLCDLVGFSEDELLGLSFQEITHPEDLEEDLGHIEQLIAGEIDAYQMEKRYIRKDGSVVPVLLSVSLVRDRDGAPARLVSQIQDRTSDVQRRTLELELSERRRADALNVLARGRRRARLQQPARRDPRAHLAGARRPPRGLEYPPSPSGGRIERSPDRCADRPDACLLRERMARVGRHRARRVRA